MKLHHDPKVKLPIKRRARLDALMDKALDAEPEQIERWLSENLKTIKDARRIIKMLILAMGELKERTDHD